MNELDVFLGSREAKDYNRIRAIIKQECYISNPTLWNWRNGKRPIAPIYQDKINQIANREFGVKVFETNN